MINLIFEGDVCRKGLTLDSDYVCTSPNNCKSFAQSIKDRNYLDICSFNGPQPIICCPDTINLPNSKIINAINADESTQHYTYILWLNYLFHVFNITRNYDWFPVCLRYFELVPKKENDVYISVVGGEKAELNEFPHMVSLNINTWIQILINIYIILITKY